MREYRLVSADGHVNEPPDVWKDRLPNKFQHRAPRMEHMELGDAWVMEGYDGPINFGMNACAGLPPEQVKPWVRWDEVPAHCYDPAARIKAQDDDGVDAEFLYSTPRIGSAIFLGNSDPEFQVACVRAYNDWLSELCSYDPERLIGLAMMPTCGVDAAVEELNRSMKLPGMKSPFLGMWPSGGPTISPADDKFWAAVQEMGAPVSVHGSISSGGRGDGDSERVRPGARGELRGLGMGTAENCLEFLNAGAFDRFPNLKVVFAEVESSWVPCARQTLDDRFKRHGARYFPNIKETPGHYFDHNIYTTFVLDRYGVMNRHLVGLSQMMWSSDYFHIVCEWPNNWDTIDQDFEGVPEDEKHLILAGNAAEVYGLNKGR